MLVEELLRAVDRAWPRTREKIPLRIIGSTALMLQANYVRGTNDSDIVTTTELTKEIQDRLIALAGPKTKLHERYRLYVQIVPGGLLFRRQNVKWHPLTSLNTELRSFHVEVMDVVDVVVSKLKRLSPNDIVDIEAMRDRDLLTHEAVVDVFRHAVDFTMDAKAEDLPKWRANLHRVERDIFGIDDPTEIELPSWVCDD